MEKLKVVTELENRIDWILSDRKAELEQLDEKIQAAETAISTADAQMQKATVSGDLDEYRQAKAERQTALDMCEMSESRRVALETKPLITEAEYRRTLADVRAELAAENDAAKQKLTALSDQMNGIAEELHDKLNRANDALARLQHDVYRDADRSRNSKTGEILPIEHERAQDPQAFYGTVKWGRVGVENPGYSAYTTGRQ